MSRSTGVGLSTVQALLEPCLSFTAKSIVRGTTSPTFITSASSKCTRAGSFGSGRPRTGVSTMRGAGTALPNALALLGAGDNESLLRHNDHSIPDRGLQDAANDPRAEYSFLEIARYRE